MKNMLKDGVFNQKLAYLYGEEAVASQCNRFVTILDNFSKVFTNRLNPQLFSAPGRTEIGGNHTDHQHGCIVAASVDLDIGAAAEANGEQRIRVLSEGYPMTEVDLTDLSVREAEYNQTSALIRGVAAGMKERGYNIGGFDAYLTSNVLQGSGLSSSAAFEVMIGTILNHLFNDGAIDPIVIAQIGQYAENVHFGKPCGLLDQMACSVGGYVAVDFYDPSKPIVEKVDFDFAKSGYTMCIVDTKGSHADLTDEYAAVPAEMKQVAAYFGKDVLRQVPAQTFYEKMGELRSVVSDRAIMRACHFYEENRRAQQMAHALKIHDFDLFLKLSNESGLSSYMYLQNVYTCKDPQNQGVSIALCAAQRLLRGRGSCRVHGGGFAGTIQCFVPNEQVEDFRREMEKITGEGTCHLLSIRPVGGVKLA